MKREFQEPVLWEHQKNGVERATQPGVDCFAFLYDVGTGKTLTLISTLRHQFNRMQAVLPTLVLSPKVTLENWRNEWLQFSRIDEKRVVVLKGPVKKRVELLNKKIQAFGGNIIVITNYEGIRVKELYEAVMKWHPSVLVCDESHRCKKHNSKTTQSVTKIAYKANFRYLLTGTLLTNSEFDVFSQWRILDKGKSFGRNFYHFRNKYFYDENAGIPKENYYPSFQIRSGAYDDMQKHLEKNSLKAMKEECIDLPDLVKTQITVEPTAEQKRIYKELSREFISEVKENKFATAETALTKALRLAQIASGFIKTEEGQIVRLKNERQDALKEILFDRCVEGKGKVIVWCVFKENYEQVREVCRSLNLEFKEGHGEVKDVAKEVSEFDIGKYDVLIGHPASIGIGVNIKSAGTTVYFSRNFSLEQRLQSEARNYRGGSINFHKKIEQIDLVCKDTIDEQITLALKNKLSTAEKILDLVRSSLC